VRQLSRKLRNARCLLHNQAVLAQTIRQQQCRWVLFGSYFEYLAPLWAWRLRQLARAGVVFGAVVHDPVRDFQLGPAWWHRRCVAAGYSFLREAFVHEAIPLDTARPMPALRTTVIPHGPYRFPPALHARAELRRQLSLPAAARVVLVFGHIRDGKNLDLLLQALVTCPDLHLLVAGEAQSSGQKPAAHYRQMAGRLGVTDRCRWVLGHIAPGEVGGFFEASDLVALTYSRAFRSASGVLNVAVQFRKPCLASSGEGNLKSKVLQYGLGIWVEPDAAAALARGLQAWLAAPPTPRWADYERENSWARNAELVAACLTEQRP
jgi:glycosyltransferase involved in cell wall biosynthesis